MKQIRQKASDLLWVQVFIFAVDFAIKMPDQDNARIHKIEPGKDH